MEVRKFGGQFCTRHSEAQLVVPAKPTPHETKKLSDIDDQEGLRFQLPLVMFFHGRESKSKDDPALVIKEAISEALVYYYPLAGRLGEVANRKLVVECNGEGVLFVEAEAVISLMELGDEIMPPCLISITFFFPCLPLNTFLDALSCSFRPNKTETISGWTGSDRTGRFLHSPNHEYHEPTSSQPDPQNLDSLPDNQTVHESFFFGPNHILSLRNRLPRHLRNCSTFELLTACLWKCRTEALDLKPSEIVSISPFITARGKQSLDLPDGYYGNAFAFPTAISDAGLICNNPMGYALELIREAKAQMNKEYMSSVADLMVLKGRPTYRRNGNYLVADSTRVGFYEVDFGWGKAVYGGPAGAIPYVSFYAAFKNTRGQDGIVVPILLPRKAMNRFLSLVEKITSENAMDDQSHEYADGMAKEVKSKL
ncbi:LOW QUALITY PROTEIN: benzyl alcohol O-benzoyltransferase-like [Prosopis cineraria]|uniref:LOW QUALITY PROTEIN: benzyl alcohol O-benzoyltransferase-like n=1 Tax=Prosopis cineraria TaxID=364024 RepID=UPI00240EDE7A|nr:LOW QUALITY PROTEIN: benzyl alcohol O-benzoyltransferase-like [Prosopis cineraria]